VQIVVYSSIGIAFLTGIISWLSANIRASRNVTERELAFQIAEAGIDYYRWHIAHAPTDYKDGGDTDGPYVHPFINAEGVRVGEFLLLITPPPSGGTMVTVLSEGRVDTNSSAVRKIEAKLAIPSYAKYAMLVDSTVYIAEQTVVEGLLHSNSGIRHDGLSKNLVTSAKFDYIDSAHSGGKEYAVHTHKDPVDPLPPEPLPLRADVFMAGRSLSVPNVDFDSLALELAIIKEKAEQGGFYRGDSGGEGYRVLLTADGTFSLYKVTGVLQAGRRSCKPGEDPAPPRESMWSISTEELIGNFAYPENGLIFLEDDAWVEGVVDGARLTIAVGVFPEAPGQHRNIIVNNSITYGSYDGTDTLGLVAQGDIAIGLHSEDLLRIDSAIIAKNGRLKRFYYTGPKCEPYDVRQSLTVYGSIASKEEIVTSWTDGTGYQNIDVAYDANLLYNPPPFFPLTSNIYETISWEDVTHR